MVHVLAVSKSRWSKEYGSDFQVCHIFRGNLVSSFFSSRSREETLLSLLVKLLAPFGEDDDGSISVLRNKRTRQRHMAYMGINLRICVGTRFLSTEVDDAKRGDRGDIGEFMFKESVCLVSKRAAGKLTQYERKKDDGIR